MMQTDVHTEAGIPRKRLWFGVYAAIAAWIANGLLGVFVSWEACRPGSSLSPGEARLLLLVLSAVLIGLAVVGWFTSYRNWSRVASQSNPLESRAQEPEEFLSVAGTLIASALLFGLLWSAVPLFVIQTCVTSR